MPQAVLALEYFSRTVDMLTGGHMIGLHLG